MIAVGLGGGSDRAPAEPRGKLPYPKSVTGGTHGPPQQGGAAMPRAAAVGGPPAEGNGLAAVPEQRLWNEHGAVAESGDRPASWRAG